MNNKKGIEKDDLYQILVRNISWIENCDTKSSVILGGVGVIIAIILSSEYVVEIKKIIDKMFVKGAVGIIYVIFGALTLLSIVTGVFFLVKVLLFLPGINIK